MRQPITPVQPWPTSTSGPALHNALSTPSTAQCALTHACLNPPTGCTRGAKTCFHTSIRSRSRGLSLSEWKCNQSRSAAASPLRRNSTFLTQLSFRPWPLKRLLVHAVPLSTRCIAHRPDYQAIGLQGAFLPCECQASLLHSLCEVSRGVALGARTSRGVPRQLCYVLPPRLVLHTSDAGGKVGTFKLGAALELDVRPRKRAHRSVAI
jgi:hypothetical protein